MANMNQQYGNLGKVGATQGSGGGGNAPKAPRADQQARKPIKMLFGIREGEGASMLDDDTLLANYINSDIWWMAHDAWRTHDVEVFDRRLDTHARLAMTPSVPDWFRELNTIICLHATIMAEIQENIADALAEGDEGDAREGGKGDGSGGVKLHRDGLVTRADELLSEALEDRRSLGQLRELAQSYRAATPEQLEHYAQNPDVPADVRFTTNVLIEASRAVLGQKDRQPSAGLEKPR